MIDAHGKCGGKVDGGGNGNIDGGGNHGKCGGKVDGGRGTTGNGTSGASWRFAPLPPFLLFYSLKISLRSIFSYSSSSLSPRRSARGARTGQSTTPPPTGPQHSCVSLQ